jgi:hypothetical protein
MCWLLHPTPLQVMATGFLLVIAGRSFKPSLAGLALTYALQMGQLFQFATRLMSETEAIFTSVRGHGGKRDRPGLQFEVEVCGRAWEPGGRPLVVPRLCS